MNRVDRFLARASGGMTHGQRWTAGLGLVFSTCVVLFGLPVKTTVTPPAALALASAPPVTVQTVPPPSPPGETVPVPIATATPGPASPGVSGGPANAVGVAAPRSTPGWPRVAVLTGGSPTGLPGRDDASIAGVFLAHARFPWTTVDMATPAACTTARAAGSVAVASQSLDPALRGCLLRAGMTILAFDESGTGGGLLSTRRGDVATLVDLARWGRASRALAGRVGLVLDADRRAALEPALPKIRAAGVRVAATAWVGTGASRATDFAGQVTAFQRAGVEDVVFAAPVETQGAWAGVASALRAPFHYVVSDVDDGVVNETYPATFDGAVAHTSLRVPWFARDHGMTAAQRQCADQWTAAVTPAVLLQAEQQAVYAWCEEVAALDTGPPPDLGAVRIHSPLTSDVAALPGGGWGPTEDAALVWRSSCACWRQLRPFATRGT